MSSQLPESTSLSPSTAEGPATSTPTERADAANEGQGGGLTKTTGSRRLLEEDQPLAPTESTQAWFAQGATARLEEIIRLVAARPQRKPFSHAAQKTAEAMADELSTRLDQADVSFSPMAGAAPRRPPAFWFLIAGAALILLAPLQMSLCLLLFLALAIGACLEFVGIVRFSRLCWPPRGGYLVEAKNTRHDIPESQDERQVLVLWAALDTPPADLVYHPARFASLLEPLYKIRALPTMIVAVALLLGLLALWWWSVSTGYAAGLVAFLWAFVMAGLAAALGWFYESSQERGADAGSVAVAVEAFQRLQKLSLPYDLRLVLVGASHTHVGIEAWLRQRSASMWRRDCMMLGVMPLGMRGGQLAYGTHHGFVWPLPISSDMRASGDWTAARLASLSTESRVPGSAVPDTTPKFAPARWHGSTPGLWSLRFGVKTMIIGDSEASLASTGGQQQGHLLHPDEAVAAVSIDALDTAAAFVVALAQAQILEREANDAA